MNPIVNWIVQPLDKMATPSQQTSFRLANKSQLRVLPIFEEDLGQTLSTPE
jgi:hypothetical protein